MAQFVLPVTTTPMAVVALDGEVVVCSPGPKPFSVALTPEAVLLSLDPLRRAAEEARAQRPAAGR